MQATAPASIKEGRQTNVCVGVNDGLYRGAAVYTGPVVVHQNNKHYVPNRTRTDTPGTATTSTTRASQTHPLHLSDCIVASFPCWSWMLGNRNVTSFPFVQPPHRLLLSLACSACAPVPLCPCHVPVCYAPALGCAFWLIHFVG